MIDRQNVPSQMKAGIIVICSVGMLNLAACSGNDALPFNNENATSEASNSHSCGAPASFVNPSAGSQPEEIGLRFSKSFLNCLMATAEEGTWVLDVTEKGALTMPFNHAFVKWNPTGHPPPMVYEEPHIDVHFHMVPPEEREGYCELSPDQSGCLVFPTPDEIPPGYVPTEPATGHGFHWVSADSPEFTGEGFSTTLIYGSYGGDMIFIEPMVTGQFLLSSPPGTQRFAVPQPTAVGLTGWYPQNYEIRFDDASNQYEILLVNFQFRESGS